LKGVTLAPTVAAGDFAILTKGRFRGLCDATIPDFGRRKPID
jgi:hypothetical protein